MVKKHAVIASVLSSPGMTALVIEDPRRAKMTRNDKYEKTMTQSQTLSSILPTFVKNGMPLFALMMSLIVVNVTDR